MNDVKTQKKWAKTMLSLGRATAETADECEARGDLVAAAMIRKTVGANKRVDASISVLGRIVRSTEKAILFSAEVGDYVGEAWLPKSMCQTFAGDQYGLTRLTAPAFMIREKFHVNYQK